jgi:hypothetical protein
VSVTSRPAQQQLCGHRRCILASRLATVMMLAAFACTVPMLLAPSIGWCAVTAGLLAAAFTAIYWPCPRRSDLEALMEATREPHPAATRHERAGQQFRGLRGHFAEWEKELDQP